MPPTPLNDEEYANNTFPPPPNPAAPPLSSSPSSVASRAAANALHRALLASKKLWRTGTSKPSTPRDYHDNSTPASPHRRQIIALGEGEQDPLEDKLLGELEELAQKTDVLTRWADEMYDYVKAVPQSKERASFLSIQIINVPPFCNRVEPLADPNRFTRRDGEAERQAKLRKNADVEAEYNAVTCIAVYMLLMSFSQKGIDKLRVHQEHMKMRHPAGDYIVSEGFDDGTLK